MEGLLIKYGLIAVFSGAMFEGDLVIPTAGSLASFGWLPVARWERPALTYCIRPCTSLS